MTITTSNILIVEDERIVAKDIKFSLESLGYAVCALAASGEEAIKKAAKFRPDLVLMDIKLKGDMDGVEAAEEIYTRWNIPIIYLTANSDKSTLQRAKEVGPFGYILKPFEEPDLLTTIETALQRYQLEKKLKESERWWATTLTSVGDAVIATDAQGRINFLNPVAETLTGWKHEDALGRDVTEVLKIINEQTRRLIEHPVTKVLQEGVVVYLEDHALLISKDRTEIPIGDSAAPIKDDQGNLTGVVVVFHDITERKQARESRLALERAKQLETQMAELQRLNQLKDDFLSTVSHELRTPMTNIKMALSMLEIALARSNEFLPTKAQPSSECSPAARYLQILKNECGKEIALINNLLDLQRLEAGVQPLNLEIIYFQTWLPQLIEPFAERAQNRQLSLQVTFPADLPPLVSDSASLGRILAELLNNACKYTPPGEEITIVVRVQEGIMQLQVSNSGVEIPAEELPCIFDKFYRVPSTDPWKQGGTGLGLALVKKLTEHLGGCISVESASLETCFTIELPIHAHEREMGERS